MKPRIRPIWTVILSLSLLVAGCGPLVDLQGEGPAPDIYALADLDAPALTGFKRSITVQIEEPTVVSMLKTDRIAVVQNGQSISYLPNARWSDHPRRLVGDQLHEMLENVDNLLPLYGSTLEIPSDYRLKIRIRRFNVIDNGDGLSAAVQLSTLLLSSQDGRVIDHAIFDQMDRTPSSDPAQLVDALNNAEEVVLTQLTRWLHEAITKELESL